MLEPLPAGRLLVLEWLPGHPPVPEPETPCALGLMPMDVTPLEAPSPMANRQSMTINLQLPTANCCPQITTASDPLNLPPTLPARPAA